MATYDPEKEIKHVRRKDNLERRGIAVHRSPGIKGRKPDAANNPPAGTPAAHATVEEGNGRVVLDPPVGPNRNQQAPGDVEDQRGNDIPEGIGGDTPERSVHGGRSRASHGNAGRDPGAETHFPPGQSETESRGTSLPLSDLSTDGTLVSSNRSSRHGSRHGSRRERR